MFDPQLWSTGWNWLEPEGGKLILTLFSHTPGKLRGKQNDPWHECPGLATACAPCLRQGTYL